MNLEPNMYIRTKEGKIDKVLEINTEDFDEPVVRLASYPIGMYQGMFEYKNASYELTDLIEVGDIIKFDITDTDNYAEIQGYNCWEISCEEELNGVKEMIEMESAKLLSIVTKEQFKSISYEVSK